MIYTGPRGGKFILVNSKKVYVTSGTNTGNRNVLGRAIYQGMRGKLYVITSGGGKSYKFAKSTKPHIIVTKNNVVPRKALLLAEVPNIIPKISRKAVTNSKRFKQLLSIVNK